MQNAETAAPRQPDEVELNYSNERLLLRYAQGRIAHFPARHVLTMAGGLMLAVGAHPVLAFLSVCLAMVGEAVDCMLLRSLPERLKRGENTSALLRLSTLSAVFQASTISGCVLIAWYAVAGEAPFFPLAFLAGAGINAGMVLPYHRTAAVARLGVFGATMLLLVGLLLFRHMHFNAHGILNAAGALILAYMVYQFLLFVTDGAKRNRRNLFALAEKSRLIADANTRLRKSQKETEQLALVARNANDSVFLSDPQRRIVWANEAFTKITGYSTEEAAGKTIADLLNGPETCAETSAAIADAAKNGEPFRGEIRSRTRDGSYIWLETNQVPIVDSEGRVEMTVAIERDVTAARQYARDLALARDRAEQGARAKAMFLANMSHEIRTPMNGVIGMADLLCATDLDADQRTYAEAIRNSAESLLELINDILDLSKLNARKMELAPADFDLPACLRDAVVMFRAQAESKGLALSLDIGAEVPLRVHGDDRRLRQILVNLIGNGLKFTEAGLVAIDVRRDPETGPCGVRIEVSDTGIGIAEEHLDRVFERFSQADSNTTRRFGGSGLGLTISRMLAEAMGGHIQVASEPGKGSCFSVTLPFAAAQSAAAEPTDTPAGEDLAAALRGKRVLVAEDNRLNRLLVQKYLHGLPLELRFACDGREAVELARDEQPDLVLMDMSMPVMGGIEAAQEIRRSEGPQPVIVALTAHAFASDRTACLDAGMDGFLTKPIRRSELLAAMIRHCNVKSVRAAG